MASATSSVRMWSAIDQPTISRVHRSITVARYSHPSAVGRQVMSPTNEVPQNQIRCRRRRTVLSRQRPRLPSRYPDDLTVPHDPGDTFAVHHVPLVPEFPGDPQGPVGSPGIGVDLPDAAGQALFLIGLLLPCLLVLVPDVVAGAVPSENVAHPLHPVGVPALVDETEADHRVVSRAK